jgi:hypothetical protein
MGEVPEMRENAALVVEQRRRIVSCELQLLPVLLADNGGFLGRQPVSKRTKSDWGDCDTFFLPLSTLSFCPFFGRCTTLELEFVIPLLLFCLP